MSYTRTWDDTIPAGTAQASSIDDSIRALRVDIHERMDEVFNDWLNGPLTLKSSALGPSTSKTLILDPHGGNFQTDLSSGNLVYEDEYVQSPGTGPAFKIPFILPVGSTITKIQYYGERVDASAWQAQCKKCGLNLSPVAENLHSPLETSNTGVQMVDTGTISVAILADTKYFLQWNGDGIYRAYGAKIFYDTPPSV
jgi:hypothetical protein